VIQANSPEFPGQEVLPREGEKAHKFPPLPLDIFWN